MFKFRTHIPFILKINLMTIKLTGSNDIIIKFIFNLF